MHSFHDTGQWQHLLGHMIRDKASTSGSRDEVHQHTPMVACHLHGTVGACQSCSPPLASRHRDDGKFAQDDDPLDGSSDLRGALHTKTTW